MRETSVLIISGSMGAGKTTLLGEAVDLLKAANIHHAAIDLDALDLGHLPISANVLLRRNLAAVWGNYAAAGISRLLISGALETSAQRDEIRSAIPDARIVICRLRASLETMQHRVRLREPGPLQEQFVARVAVLESALDASALEDFAVDNDGRPVADVAREVLARAGWLREDTPAVKR